MPTIYDEERPGTSSDAIKKNPGAYPFAAAVVLAAANAGDDENGGEGTAPQEPDDAWIPRRAREVTARDIHQLMAHNSAYLNNAGMYNMESALWEETSAALRKLDRGLLAPGDAMLAVKHATGRLISGQRPYSVSGATGLPAGLSSAQAVSLKKKKIPGGAGRPFFLKGSSTPEEWQKKKAALSRDVWRQISSIDALLGAEPATGERPRRWKSSFMPVLAPVPARGGQFDPAAAAPQSSDRSDAAFDARSSEILKQQQWTIPDEVRDLAIAFAWMQMGLSMLASHAPAGDSATDADAEDIARLLIISGVHSFARILATLAGPVFQVLKTVCTDVWNRIWHGLRPDGQAAAGDDWFPDQRAIRPLEPGFDPEEFERQFMANLLMLWGHVSGEMRDTWDRYRSMPVRDKELHDKWTRIVERAENIHRKMEHAGEDDAARFREPFLFSDDASMVQFSVGHASQNEVVFAAAESSFENAARRDEPVEVKYLNERIDPLQGLQSSAGRQPQTLNSTVGAVLSKEAKLAGEANAVLGSERYQFVSGREPNPLLASKATVAHRTYVDVSEQRWAEKTGQLRIIHVEFRKASPDVAQFEAVQFHRNGTTTRTAWEMPVGKAHKEELMSIARPAADSQTVHVLSGAAQMLLQPGVRFFEEARLSEEGAIRGNATATGMASALNSFFTGTARKADAGMSASLFSGGTADVAGESARSPGNQRNQARPGEIIPLVSLGTAAAVAAAMPGPGDIEAMLPPEIRENVPSAVAAGMMGLIRRNPLRAVAGAVAATALTAGGGIFAYLSLSDQSETDDGTEVSPGKALDQHISAHTEVATESPEQATVTGQGSESAVNATGTAKGSKDVSDAGTTPASVSPTTENPDDRDFFHDVMFNDYSMEGESENSPRILTVDEFESLYPDNTDFIQATLTNKYKIIDDVTRFLLEELAGENFEFDFSKATEDGVGGIDIFEGEIDLHFKHSVSNSGRRTKTLIYEDKKSEVTISLIVPILNTRIKKDIDRQISALNADVRKVKKTATFDSKSRDSDPFKYGSYILYPGQQAAITSIDENFPMRIFIPESKNGNETGAGRIIENNSVARFYYRSEIFLNSDRVRIVFWDGAFKERLVLTGNPRTIRPLANTIRVLEPRSMANEQHRFSRLHERKENKKNYFSYSLTHDQHVIYELIKTLEIYNELIFKANPKIRIPSNKITVPFEKIYYANLLKVASEISEKYEAYWLKTANLETGENNLEMMINKMRHHFMRSIVINEYKLSKDAAELVRLAFFKSLKLAYASNLQRPDLHPDDERTIRKNIARFSDIEVNNFRVLGTIFHDVVQFFDKKTKITLLYFIGADDPFFEFESQEQLHEWFRGVALDYSNNADIKSHIELSDRSERTTANNETLHGFDYLLDHADETTSFLGMKPTLIESEVTYFTYFAQAARVRLLTEARFIQGRSEYMLGDYYARTSQSGEMSALNLKMVKMVHEKYKKLGPPHVQYEHALNSQGRELYWLREVENSRNLEYAHISEESVEQVLKDMNLENREPDIITIAGRANRKDIEKLLKEISDRIAGGNDCSDGKSCLDFQGYKNAVDIVHETLGRGAAPSYTERSMYIEQINRLKDIRTLAAGDNTEKHYKKIHRASWELTALAYRFIMGSDYVYNTRDIMEIAVNAMAINHLVDKLMNLSHDERNNTERKNTMLSIARELDVYDQWQPLIENHFPLSHQYDDVEDSGDPGSGLQTQVSDAVNVIIGADIRFVRLAENYLRRVHPEMTGSVNDFRWQLEIARIVGEIAKLPDKEEYGVINIAGIDRAASVLMRDKGMKWYAEPAIRDFLEKSLEKTMEDLLDNVYKRGQPYWTRQDDGSDIDPTGGVRRVPVDVSPGIVSDYSGYTLKTFLHNLDKALENPFGDLAVQIMNVHGNWTEEDKKLAKAIGGAIQKSLELAGYIPLIGDRAATALAFRPIASSITKFVKRRVDEGGSFGIQDVKDVATIIWTYVGLKIPGGDFMPISIASHIGVSEGIGMIPG